MNRAIFWRLLWKEYRLQRSFWIAMAVLGATLLFLIMEFNDHPTERAEWLVYSALCVPVFYALGCASTMFAGEHDADTYEFQRSLPASASQSFFSKTAFAFLSTFVMLALLWFLAFAMAGGQMPPSNKCWSMWLITSEVIWLYIVWGVFFSLVLKRPLLAALVTVTVVSVALLLMPEKPYSPLLKDTTFPMLFFYPIAIFAGSTVPLAIVDVWLGRRWFCETPYPISHIRRSLELKLSAKPETLAEYLSHANSWSMIRRLSWQHWRQSAWVLIVIAAMLAPVLFFACASIWWKDPSRNGWLTNFAPIGMLSALAMPPLVGSFTFLADQRQRSFRFLADRGISPRLVWLSRLWPWLVVVFCAFAALALLFTHMYYFYLWKVNTVRPTLHDVLFVIVIVYGYIVLSICVGQFCSMFFRSGLLAGVFSLVITAMLCAWAALMWTFGVSWTWSVAPLPLVLLLATRLRTPDWLLERGGWRGWRRAGLVLAATVALLFTAVPLYRLFQIPLVDPGFATISFLRPLAPQEQSTLDLYKQAIEKYSRPPSSKEPTAEKDEAPLNEDPTHPKPWKPSAEEIEWVNANQEVIPLAVEASKGAEFVFMPSSLIESRSNPMSYAWDAIELGELLLLNAQILESEGKLDAAIEQYLAVVRISRQLHSGVRGYSGMRSSGDADGLEFRVYYHFRTWAAQSGQTAERIKKAIGELEKITADMPAGAEHVKFDYLYDRQMLVEGFKGFPSNHIPAMTVLWLRLPWERARAFRLLNVITRDDLRSIENAEMAARLNQRIKVPPEDTRYPWSYYSINNIRESEYALLKEVWVPPLRHSPQGMFLISEFADLENHRRATLIIMALQAWKLEHDAYPKTLDELVGPYLARLPNDPYSGQPYQYYPEGVKVPLPGLGISFELLSPQKSKPVIWSTSPNIIVVSPSENEFYRRYNIYEVDFGMPFEDGRFRYADIFDIYIRGNFFLVP